MSRRRESERARFEDGARPSRWFEPVLLRAHGVDRWVRLAIVAGPLLLTAVAFGPLYRRTGLAWGAVFSALASLPAAWYWGWRAGVLVALLSSTLNTALYGRFVTETRSDLVFTFLFSFVLQVLFAGVVGHLRELGAQLRREVADRERAEAELDARARDLQMMNALNAAIVRGDSLDAVIETLASEARKAFGAYATIALLADDAQEVLVSRSAGVPKEAFGRLGRVIQDATPQAFIRMDESTLHGRTLAAGQPRLINDADELDALVGEFDSAKLMNAPMLSFLRRQLGVKSVIQVPLISDGEPLGILDIPRAEPFDEGDLERLSAVAGQLTTIIRRTLAEQALRRSVETYRALVAATPLGVTWVDLEGRIVDISEAAIQLIGAPDRDQLLGQSMLDFVAPEDRRRAQYHFASLFEGGEGGEGGETTYRLDRLDGTRLIGAVSTALVAYGEGPPSAALLTVRDVTSQTEAEEALRASEARYRGLFEASRDGIVYTFLDGQIMDANQSFLDMLGYTLEEIQQLTYHDLTPRKWSRMEADIVRDQVMVRGYSDEYAKEYIRADGTIIPIILRTSLMTDSEGNPSRLMGIVRDLSERRQLENRLRQAEQLQAVGRLAGGVAHEFNNLLTVINGYAEMLLAVLPDGDRMRSDLETIVKAGNRAADITAQLLAFSRQQVVERQVLDLNEALCGMSRLLGPILGNDVELEMDLNPLPCAVWADLGQIEQVIINLATNASRAMPDGGLFALCTEQIMLDDEALSGHMMLEPGPHVRLTVSDTGHGMPPEVQSRIFEPFYTTRQVGEGTGLGLAMVHGIVHQMGGDISVYSQVSRGTTFTIYFPCYAESRGVDAHDEEEAVRGGDETVLFCEDEPVVLDITTRLLRGLGYTVLSTDDPNVALMLHAQRGDEIDLIVTDVVMPQLNGLELAQRLREAGCTVPILFVSGYPEAVLARQGAAVPHDQLLYKPFGSQELARRLRRTLDGDAAGAI